MTKYVVGFMFNHSMTRVLLVDKKRPDWQKGYYNGVGGHVEPSESFGMAMVREFEEETGIKTSLSDWQQFCSLKGADNSWVVAFFLSTGDIDQAVSMTDEDIVNIDCKSLSKAINNLNWLIPLAKSGERIKATYDSFGL
jgi:8-oxo-dGTP diphosphatase